MSAGGNCLNVWDIVGGGRLLRKLSNFQKTVTCVTLSPMAGPDSSASPRMLAGSLDGHLKVCRGGVPSILCEEEEAEALRFYLSGARKKQKQKCKKRRTQPGRQRTIDGLEADSDMIGRL